MACGHTEPLSKRRRVLILIIGFLECFVFGGSYFGWASLAFVLKQDGVYGHLCQNHSSSTDGQTNVVFNSSETEFLTMQGKNSTYLGRSQDVCAAQDGQLGLAFTIGLVMLGALAFPLGWMFDRFGLLVMRCLSW